MSCRYARAALIIAFFVVSAIIVKIVVAQDTDFKLIDLSNNETVFIGIEGITGLSRTVNIIGVADEPINVTLVPSELYENKSGKNVPPSQFTIMPNSFFITKNEALAVNITINTSYISEGNYFGTIIVTAENSTNIELSNISVTVRIQSQFSSIISYVSLGLIALFGTISLALGERYHVGKFWVIGFGMLTITIWIFSINASTFLDPGNIIGTILIGNVIGYIIYYVKDRREVTRELEKISREIRNKGLGTDIELIKMLMGEITTHYTSFTSLYFENGLLSRKVWDESAKQGTVTDLPIYRLESYYSFVQIYNRYYSRAIKLLKEQKKEDLPEAEFNFSLFESFREKYSELEKIIFVNLQYDLGLVTTLCLSPLKTEYPRISRTLLYELVDIDVLKPPEGKSKTDYKDKIKKWGLKSSDFEKIGKEIYKGESTHKFLGYIDKQFKNRYKELREIVERLPLLSKEESESEKETPDIKGAFTL